MDGHDGQPILDLVGHLHQLLGHAMPCQWDNRHLATTAQFVEGRYNEATNYFNYLPQVVVCTPALWTAVNG